MKNINPLGIFDDHFLMEKLTRLGDPLQKLNEYIDWKIFESPLIDAYKDEEKEFKLFETYAGNNLEQIILLVSSSKPIMEEWRCVVVDRKVVAFSQYQVCGKLNIKRTIKPGALLLAEEIAKEEWQPDIAYTLDVCKSNEEYGMLEVNSFSCSGLYKSDMMPIVSSISEVAVKEWLEYNEIV